MSFNATSIWSQAKALFHANLDLFALLAVVLLVTGGLLIGWLVKSRRPGLYVRCPVDGKEYRGHSFEDLAAFLVDHERLHPGEP